METSRLTVLNSDDLTPLIPSKDLMYQPQYLELTQKYIIICYNNHYMEWLLKYDKYQLADEDYHALEMEKFYYLEETDVSCFMYNHFYSHLFVGTTDGTLLTLELQAESWDESDDEGDDQGSNHEEAEKQQKLDLPAQKFGPFSTAPVTFLRQMNRKDALIVCNQSGVILLFDLAERKTVRSYQFSSEILCGDIDHKDQLLLLGTKESCIKIIDIRDIKNFRPLKTIRLFQKPKPITSLQFSPNHQLIAASSKTSRKLFFLNSGIEHLSSAASSEFSLKQLGKIIGFIQTPQYNQLSHFIWNTKTKPPLPESQQSLLAISNFLLFSIACPDSQKPFENTPLDEIACPIFVRKIDPECNCLTTFGNYVAISGKDKLLKLYKFPEEALKHADLRVRVPSQAPVEEYDGHALPPNCMALSTNSDYIVSGSQDGTIYIREVSNLGSFEKIKAHNYKTQGVSFLAFNHDQTAMYSSGNDGSIFLWQLTDEAPSYDKELPNMDFTQIKDEETDDTIKYYQKVLEDEYYKETEEMRQKQQKDMKAQLQQIKNKLQTLANSNRLADDLEKLDRDEFVIDIATQHKLLDEGNRQKAQLRENAKRQVISLELRHQKIKKTTWDNMDTQLQCINGLRENIILYNFHINKRSAVELKRLHLMLELRRVEIKELRQRQEQKLKEIIEISELFRKPENYIVNMYSGKPMVLILGDYRKTKQSEDRQAQLAASLPTVGGGSRGYGIFGPPKKANMRLGAGALRRKAQKKMAEDGGGKQENDDLPDEEELLKMKKLEDDWKKQAFKDPAELQDWDFLYGATDLFTTNRKRNQIFLIQNLSLIHI
eukprot:TRINITY_DN6551_c0_g1_i9.p1 TRINITY_DN6551_c0_g1~~TRINITY_DN6551_c0_g1_i9.p1  ORF type:complete len:828 (-),score=112.12 TRINITY_DN6551_c0_g1_i9:145-2628(-)